MTTHRPCTARYRPRIAEGSHARGDSSSFSATASHPLLASRICFRFESHLVSSFFRSLDHALCKHSHLIHRRNIIIDPSLPSAAKSSSGSRNGLSCPGETKCVKIDHHTSCRQVNSGQTSSIFSSAPHTIWHHGRLGRSQILFFCRYTTIVRLSVACCCHVGSMAAEDWGQAEACAMANLVGSS